jgi:hypothetical protein
MLNRLLLLLSGLALFFTSACAPNQLSRNVSRVAAQVVPVAQQVLNEIASAEASPPLPTQALPTSRSATRRSGPTTIQPTESTAVRLNGASLALKQTAHEDIYVASGTPAAYVQSVVGDASAAAQRMVQDEGWGGAPKVEIFVFPSRAVWLQGISQIGQLPTGQVRFQAQLEGDSWITISGTGNPGVYIYPIVQSAFDMLHMLAHEYTHAIQRQVVGDNILMPDWFVEGMAEAEGWHIAGQTNAAAYAQVHNQTVAFVRRANRQGQLLPLMSISSQSSWQSRLEAPRSATLEYAESQLAIEYLQQVKGSNAPMNILRQTAAAGEFAGAFQSMTGITVPQLQVAFAASLK